MALCDAWETKGGAKRAKRPRSGIERENVDAQPAYKHQGRSAEEKPPVSWNEAANRQLATEHFGAHHITYRMPEHSSMTIRPRLPQEGRRQVFWLIVRTRTKHSNRLARDFHPISLLTRQARCAPIIYSTDEELYGLPHVTSRERHGERKGNTRGVQGWVGR